uniref:Serine hydrolase domain-containing protein n=1 Tax=Amphora coffeiformis TaxID=265554 RepID=A0A7S3P652_9STRA|mmetsp:Transcript_6337/g.13044  ORF Transcript_6337/g.13044 Transcript_6337/m.13044 type:complete len:335 (+) Transcript_6337:222-1226(+)
MPPSSKSSSSSTRQRRNHHGHNNNNNRGPPIRILCLHDANSNANSLQTKLQKFGDRLLENHNMELVYINAPLVMNQNHDNDNNHTEESQRSWWQATDEHPYLGLDASLLMLKHIWNSWSSFSGVLGVGQGAAIGALLTLWLFEESDRACQALRAPPQNAIFIDGYTVLPEDMALLSIQRLEALHILPASETPSSTEQQAACARFVTQMGGRTHIRPLGQVWHSTDCLNLMGRYLVQQKLSHQSTALAVTQQALVATEQQAAYLVQQHALAHPPPSLMAVIGPSNNVSGWSGPKRELPAGGAPCPADFVLPVHQRNHGHESATAADKNNPLSLPW